MTDSRTRDGNENFRHLRYAVRRRALSALSTRTTLAELSNDVGATDARLLWHLEALQTDGLVVSSETDGLWIRTERSDALLADRHPPGPNRAIPGQVVDDFEDAILEAGEALYGDAFVQASGEHRTRLSTEQAAEFRDRLIDLVEEYFAPGQGDRSGVKYGFHWIMTPIDLHPLEEPAST